MVIWVLAFSSLHQVSCTVLSLASPNTIFEATHDSELIGVSTWCNSGSPTTPICPLKRNQDTLCGDKELKALCGLYLLHTGHSKNGVSVKTAPPLSPNNVQGHLRKLSLYIYLSISLSLSCHPIRSLKLRQILSFEYHCEVYTTETTAATPICEVLPWMACSHILRPPLRTYRIRANPKNQI